jgi:hypothetical protein
MRTLKTPAIAKPTPTASLWDTPVPVAPTPPKATKPPIGIAIEDSMPQSDGTHLVTVADVVTEPPFDVPDEPVAEQPPEPAKKKKSKPDDIIDPKVVRSLGNFADSLSAKDGEPFDPILFLSEHKLLDPIYAAHSEIISLEAKITELSNQLKDCEFDLASASDAKATLLAALPDQLFAIRTGKKPEPAKITEAKPAAPAPQPDNAWRSVATSTITKGVVGLGTKKAEALTDEFPTLGHLCDAMARAVAAHHHFADELPKGIGRQSADELANRVMVAQTKGDTRPAAEVVEPRKVDQITTKQHEAFVRVMLENEKCNATEESLRRDKGESWDEGYEAASSGDDVFACPRELQQNYQVDWVRGWLCYDLFYRDAAEDQPGENAEPVASGEVDHGDFEQLAHEQFVADTVEWLNENLAESPFEKASNREMWQVGFDAFDEGAEAIDCPTEVAHTSEELAITEAMQIDWLRGWVSAKVKVQLPEPAVNETPEPEPATESDSIDDIAEIAKRVKADPDRKSRTSQEAWERGYEAAVDQQPLEVFPDLPTAELLDWVRGWVFGSEIDFDL